jgi:AraC family transcriptional regulator
VKNPYLVSDEPGVIKKRGDFFGMPSSFVKNNFYYVLWCGEYACMPPYEVKRSYMNSFLFFWIMDGNLEVNYEGENITASKNSFVLLDCKKKNHYYTKDYVSFQYMHFKGPDSDFLCDELINRRGCHFSGEVIQNMIPSILEMVSSCKRYEYEISAAIYRMLCTCFNEAASGDSLVLNKAYEKLSKEIEKSINYIQRNFSDCNMSVSDISAHAGMSLYHFTRVFKAEVGLSPYQYLLDFRLMKAKRFLVESEKTISWIAETCGFSSSSAFIRAFKANNMVSPGEFRKTKF